MVDGRLEVGVAESIMHQHSGCSGVSYVQRELHCESSDRNQLAGVLGAHHQQPVLRNRQKTKDEQAECPCPAGMLSSFTSCEDDILVSWRYLCERSRAVELEGTSVACAAHSVRLMPSLSLFWTVMTLTVCHTCLFAFFLLSSLSCTVGSLELHVCGSRQEHRV